MDCFLGVVLLVYWIGGNILLSCSFNALKTFIVTKCTGPITLAVETVDKRTSSMRSDLDATNKRLDEIDAKLDKLNSSIEQTLWIMQGRNP